MVQDIRLLHFRSYTDELFEFDPGVNIIVGPNASGKTNLLEAIQMVCSGSSYRVRDNELIRNAEPWARLDAHTSTGQRSVKLEKQNPLERVQKTFEISGQPYKRLTYNRKLPVVLFEPNHLRLLTGGRELRRDFLDDLLEQLVADYGLLRRQYKRALAQRNALLKQGPKSTPQLFAWNVRLSELGGLVAAQRKNLVEKLEPDLQVFYRQLSSNNKIVVNLRYEASCDERDYGSSLLSKLETSTELDYQRGFTAYGPHRDDMQVMLNGRQAAETASRGEVRTLLLGLKLLELKLVEEQRSYKPLLLLDDVFGELDGARRRALTEFLTDHQAFITTTDADIVVQHFIGKANIVPIAESS